MELIELYDISYLNCGHGFHLKCRNTCISTYHNCPVCRQPVSNIDQILDSHIPHNITFTDSEEDEFDEAEDEIDEAEIDEAEIDEDEAEDEAEAEDEIDEAETEDERSEESELINDQNLNFVEKLKFYRKTRIPEIHIYTYLFNLNDGNLITIEEFNNYIINNNISHQDYKLLSNLYSNNYPDLPVELDLYDNSKIKKITLYNRTLDTGELLEDQPLLYTIITKNDNNYITYKDIFLGIKKIKFIEDPTDNVEGIYYQGEYENNPVYEVVFENNELEIQSE
jgi:hypothetical protein